MEERPEPIAVDGNEWQEITDLPKDWEDLCRDDLRALHRQWMADRQLVMDEEKVKKFQQELAMRWAIETGIIERLYRVERGVTVQIAQAGMEALGTFHARGKISSDARALITDQREALEMVMDLVGGGRDLTSSYVKELQHRLTLSQETCEAEDQFGERVNVPLRKGDWKLAPNNPRRPDGTIHQYCPPERVQDQIDQLLNWHEAHRRVCAEVEAAWLHHRFTQIHPFQDGNGRVARALTGSVFLKEGYLVLVIRDEEHRDQYLDALAAADSGDLKPLVDLFADIQISDLRDAIETLRQLRGEPLIKAAETLAIRARRRAEAGQEQAEGIMERLIRIAATRLEEAKGEVQQAFSKQGIHVMAGVRTDDTDKRDWWHWQIIQGAKKLGYFADLNRPRRWVSLILRIPELEKKDTRFVLSLHAVGRAADLHVATSFLTGELDLGEGTTARDWENHVLSESPFRFAAETNRREQIEKLEKRFREWFESDIEAGLSKWGESL